MNDDSDHRYAAAQVANISRISRNVVEALASGNSNSEQVTANPAEHEMANFPTREELDAKLATISAEMRASLADLRGDFARSNEAMTITVSGLTNAVADLKGSIAGTQGSIDGLKTSISTMQWFVGSMVAIFGLAGTALGIWIAWAQLKQAETPSPPPVAVQSAVPQPATTARVAPAAKAAESH